MVDDSTTLTEPELERGVGRLYLRYIALEESHEALKREHEQTLNALLARVAREGEGEGHAGRMGEQTA